MSLEYKNLNEKKEKGHVNKYIYIYIYIYVIAVTLRKQIFDAMHHLS